MMSRKEVLQSWQQLLIIPSALALLWLISAGINPAMCLLQISIMLVFAYAFGRFAKKLGQPAVLGEIMGGIVLGPTVLGFLYPEFQSWLFPRDGASLQMLHIIAYLGLIAFLFIAGLEVDLACMRHRNRTTLFTSISGILLSFALGVSMVLLLPDLWGVSNDLRIFALFMGTALAISALPVIARILLDLGLLGAELGGLIITAATIDDVVGWSLFALILNSLNADASLGLILGLTLGLFTLTACMIYFKFRRGTLPPGVDFIATTMLVASVASEFLGVHAVFGAFMAGLVLSLRSERGNSVLHRTYPFVMIILAPIYFVSIGLKANFAISFDLPIILLVLIVACTGKILGAGIGALAGGMQAREAIAVGFGLNARGAMEIVLASAALDYGLIEERIFVALVVMALATTMTTGLALPKVLKTRPVGRMAWAPLPLHELKGSYNYYES